MLLHRIRLETQSAQVFQLFKQVQYHRELFQSLQFYKVKLRFKSHGQHPTMVVYRLQTITSTVTKQLVYSLELLQLLMDKQHTACNQHRICQIQAKHSTLVLQLLTLLEQAKDQNHGSQLQQQFLICQHLQLLFLLLVELLSASDGPMVLVMVELQSLTTEFPMTKVSVALL